MIFCFMLSNLEGKKASLRGSRRRRGRKKGASLEFPG